MSDAPQPTLVVGSKVLMPDLYPGTIEEIDPPESPTGPMVRVRHVAWDGGPSCLSTWFSDVLELRPLPPNFVRPEPTPQERAEAAIFVAQIEEALEGLVDD